MHVFLLNTRRTFLSSILGVMFSSAKHYWLVKSECIVSVIPDTMTARVNVVHANTTLIVLSESESISNGIILAPLSCSVSFGSIYCFWEEMRHSILDILEVLLNPGH